MTGFLLALVGPFMYACSNHIDSVLLKKYFKEGGVGILLIFSSVFALAALPFIYWYDPTVVQINDMVSILVLTAVGILNVLVLLCWFVALGGEEASISVVFYQLVPVFGGLLSYFILGEELNWHQIIAMAIVIIGTFIVSFDLGNGGDGNEVKFRWKTVILMTTAAFFWAAGAVLFKAIALEEQLWRTIFWEHLTLGVIGIFIFVFIVPCRRNFMEAVRVNSWGVLALNGVNESLYIVGNIVYSIAYMMAPLGVVLLAESFQQIFVLIIGTFLTVFFPSISTERIGIKHLTQKISAMLVTGLGVYLLSIS